MKSNVWSEIIRPMLAPQKDATATFIGTPKGKNHFHDIYKFALNEKEWSCYMMKASDSGIIPEDRLSEIRRDPTMTEAMYQQEYECDFLEDASSVFKDFKSIIWTGELDIKPDKFYQQGVDLGKHGDFTVITPIDLHNWHVGTPDRFNKIDWTLQKAKIEASARKYNDARTKLDATGIGDPIFDDLQQAGISVDPFKFTEQSRQQLLNNLIIKMEDRSIRIPNYKPLLDELEAFRYELAILPSGITKIRMRVPDGQHDDCVMSLALAVWELTNKQYHKDNEWSGEYGEEREQWWNKPKEPKYFNY